ncbi:alpha/beta hydrolase [Mycolicibacterium sp. S2-37]|uniref:alpha/beta hydrolase n=1 Tax=Mycolicibacterium sp. S2-37 TaxID=2810297 RepID=UPI001A9505CA|nr:alpha/beta hydrolase [Mycolicibacterium sp. S2-37]MBO0676648.1 alpha/beta hydrolase [Mycolicibacterium sp. S2-37]
MYIYDIDAQAMFDDRTHQFEKFGIALSDIEDVRRAVSDMWADAPGGWVYEWSALAGRYADQGEHRLASLLYGCAKFPCLTDSARERAMENQLAEFQLAATDFPVCFERRIIQVPYRGRTVEVALHVYSTDGEYARRPVLIASGGVDTWKMDIHPWWVAFAQHAGVTTVAFDHPGTGEATIPLDRHADEVIAGIARYGREIGDGRVAHFGASFGGNFAAMSGLSGIVDAAVDLGGPVLDSFAPEHLSQLPFGMHDILGNAMHWNHSPTLAELSSALGSLSRRDLLAETRNSAMLVANGADDYFVPQSDTVCFEGRPDTEVHLIPGTGHVAMSKAPEVIPMVAGWLRRQFER